MDIKSLQTKPLHDAGAEMRVKDPNGNETDFYIRLVGVDSAKWRDIKRKLERRTLEASFNGDDADIDAAEYIADATLDWRGLESDGKPVKFSRKNALDLYRNAPYICDQADRFIAKRANFTSGNSQG